MRNTTGSEAVDAAEASWPPSLDLLRTARTVARCVCREVVATPRFTLSSIDCAAGVGEWLHGPTSRHPTIVLVRVGSFVRRIHGRRALVDATQGYVLGPGDDELINHVNDGVHRCTVLAVRPDLLPPLWRVRARLVAGEFRTTPATDMVHRRLLAAGLSGGDKAAIAEMGDTLIAAVLAGTATAPPPRRRAPAAVQRAVDIARAMATDQAGASLGDIAAAAGLSPHHLTRVFKTTTGLTIGQYRNRVRIRLALEWLAEGGDDLTRIAHELGFSDHAHFSRTMLGEVGVQPRIARAMLHVPCRAAAPSASPGATDAQSSAC